ncbi:hypothetical protein [Rhizobium sp. Nf11,1]|uniref:hypothetical protein n=1 Tax=Rhizobium sp. Nf11,1 TaxID=3404923 RepID=UPI003D34FB7D
MTTTTPSHPSFEILMAKTGNFSSGAGKAGNPACHSGKTGGTGRGSCKDDRPSGT